MKNLILFLHLSFLCLAISAQQNTLFQYATFNSLAGGVYDGELKTSELLKKGNLGLGTYNGLDGELIILDSICYKATTDSSKQIEIVNDAQTPFAVNTFFEKKDSIQFEYLSRNQIDSIVLCKIPKNAISAFKIKGIFSYIKFRSVTKQKKPYPLLAQAVKQQKIFEKANIEGTLIGFYFPAYMNGINVEGFHWHFIASDKSAGGHVMDYQIDHVLAEWATMTNFQLEFPQLKEFMNSGYKAGKEETGIIEKGK